MNEEEVKVVIQVLKDAINDNEELKENDSLSKTELDSLNFESTSCCKAIKILEGLN